MPKVEMILTGDKEIDKKLQALTGKEAKKIIRQATRQSLKPVLQQAKGYAPSDSGDLEENIKVKGLARSRRFIGSRVTSGNAKGSNQGEGYYGAFLEYGTKIRKHRRSGKSVGAISPGLGFMKLAADQKKTQAQNIFREKVRIGITRLAKNG